MTEQLTDEEKMWIRQLLDLYVGSVIHQIDPPTLYAKEMASKIRDKIAPLNEVFDYAKLLEKSKKKEVRICDFCKKPMGNSNHTEILNGETVFVHSRHMK